LRARRNVDQELARPVARLAHARQLPRRQRPTLGEQVAQPQREIRHREWIELAPLVEPAKDLPRAKGLLALLGEHGFPLAEVARERMHLLGISSQRARCVGAQDLCSLAACQYVSSSLGAIPLVGRPSWRGKSPWRSFTRASTKSKRC